MLGVRPLEGYEVVLIMALLPLKNPAKTSSLVDQTVKNLPAVQEMRV